MKSLLLKIKTGSGSTMDFKLFKNEVLALAKNKSIPVRAIQSVLIRYFKDKRLPFLEELQTYVVRCGINGPGEVFATVDRCSYNPDRKKIELQRCNYPKQQVFYCSMWSDTNLAATSLTCIVETAWEHIKDIQSKRSYCTLSWWDCTRPLVVWALPFSQKSCLKNRSFFRMRAQFEKILKQEPNGREHLQALAFITKAFSARPNKQFYYRISSAFYNTLLHLERTRKVKMDGLIYPSANTEGAGLNLVLKKELVDNKTINFKVATMYVILRDAKNAKSIKAMPASNIPEADSDGRIRFTSITW